MKLKNCTRQELLWIIEQTFTPDALEGYLDDVKKNRDGAIRKLEQHYINIVEEKLAEYREIMAPYAGMAPVEVPIDVLKRAWELSKEAREAAESLDRLGLRS